MCGDQTVNTLQNINHRGAGVFYRSAWVHLTSPLTYAYSLSFSYQDGRPGCLNFKIIVCVVINTPLQLIA